MLITGVESRIQADLTPEVTEILRNLDLLTYMGPVRMVTRPDFEGFVGLPALS